MSKRPLWMIVVLLLGAAAALWGAGAVSWNPEPPPLPEERGGYQLVDSLYGFGIGDGSGDGSPDLTAVALLALAGLAGVFAVGGWPRRILGAIFGAAGGYTAWAAISIDMPLGFSLWTGRGFAFLGAAALLAAGALVMAHARRLPTMGARYEAANTGARTGDPDKDMWDGLSEGDDPTAEDR